MPVARYFLFVSGILIALLFALDTYLPKPSVVSTAEAEIRASGVRIRSDQKWPERIVYDTSLPTIVPVQAAAIAPAAPSPTKAVAAIPVQTDALNSFAQLSSSNVKKPEQAAPAQRKRKVVKRRVSPPPVMVAQQRDFGLFGSNFW